MDEERAGGACLEEERSMLGIGIEHLIHVLSHVLNREPVNRAVTPAAAPIVWRSKRRERAGVTRRGDVRGGVCYPRAALSPGQPGRTGCRSKKSARCSGSMTAGSGS